ncbi:MAG: DMT family transporter [Actinomycetota bacterium]
MGALFGSLTSLFIGLSDLFLVKTTGRSHTITVTILAFATAAATSVVGIVLLDGDPIGRDLLIGVGAGIFMGLGLVTYFQGLTLSSVGIVAPLIALQVALWPLGYDVLDGARPSGVVWVGVAVSIASLLLTTISPELGDRVGSGVRWGLLSGTAYGIGTLLSGLTSEDSGMWSVLANRLSSLMLAVVMALVMGLPLVVPKRSLPVGIIGGIFGGLALLSFVYGTQRYELAIVGVTGSLFPAVSAFLLWRFLDHPLRWWQGVGIAGVLLGTSLVAIG